MISQVKLGKIHKVLDETIKAEPTDWSVIVAAMKAEPGLKITNWLTEVRGVLQWMINTNKIKRTDDVMREQYIKLQ